MGAVVVIGAGCGGWKKDLEGGFGRRIWKKKLEGGESEARNSGEWESP
jgi:hypothetical protein